MPDRVRKPPCDAFQIGEDTVPPLIVQSAEGACEELAVIHRENPKRNPNCGVSELFLERFQVCCRGAIRQSGHPKGPAAQKGSKSDKPGAF
jgi:hypothetical protein